MKLIIILTLFLNNFKATPDSLVIKSNDKTTKYHLKSDYITIKTKNKLKFEGEIVEINDLNIKLSRCVNVGEVHYLTFSGENSPKDKEGTLKCDTFSISKRQIKTIEIETGSRHEKNHTKYLKNFKIRYTIGGLIGTLLIVSKLLVLLPFLAMLIISSLLFSMLVFDIVRSFYYRTRYKKIKIKSGDEIL